MGHSNNAQFTAKHTSFTNFIVDDYDTLAKVEGAVGRFRDALGPYKTVLGVSPTLYSFVAPLSVSNNIFLFRNTWPLC